MSACNVFIIININNNVKWLLYAKGIVGKTKWLKMLSHLKKGIKLISKTKIKGKNKVQWNEIF